MDKLNQDIKVPHGKWRDNAYTKDNKVSLMPLDFLHSIPGNKIGKTDINELKQDISSNGLNEPLILSFDPQQNLVNLGEGNHRTKALSEMGYTHAPVRGLRTWVDNSPSPHQKNISHDFGPYKNQNGYIMGDISPAKVGLPGHHYEVPKQNVGEKQASIMEPEKYQKAKDKDWVKEYPGRPTARHTKLVSLPVSYLIKLPGLRGEHKVLKLDMDKIQGMSKIVTDIKWQRENPVTLGIQHDGKIYVDDGNHRIRAAKVAGVKELLCKVIYYGGGEDKFDIDKILSKASLNDLMNTFVQLQSSGVPWGDLARQIITPQTKPAIDSVVNKVKSTLPKVNPKNNPEKIEQNAAKKQVKCFGEGCSSPAEGGLFCAKCRSIPKEERQVKGPRESKDLYMPEKHDQWWNEARRTNKPKVTKVFNKLIKGLIVEGLLSDNDASILNKLFIFADDQGISGATDVDGEAVDGEYADMHDTGIDYGGEHDPNKDDSPMLGQASMIDPTKMFPQEPILPIKKPTIKVTKPSQTTNYSPSNDGKGQNFDRYASALELYSLATSLREIREMVNGNKPKPQETPLGKPGPLTPYGWIDPKGNFFSVPGYAHHDDYENHLRDTGRDKEADNLIRSHVHVSPGDMRLPLNDITEHQVGKLMDYHDLLDSGKFDKHPHATINLGKGQTYQDTGPLQKLHVKETLDKAMGQLNNQKNNYSVYAGLKDVILKIAKNLESEGIDVESVLNKIALVNPGGVNFNMSGGNPELPSGRRPETYQKLQKNPARTKYDKKNGPAISSNEINQRRMDNGMEPRGPMQNLPPAPPEKVLKEYPRYQGPSEQRKKNNKFVSYDTSPLTNESLEKLYPSLFEGGGKHDDPNQGNMFNNFLDRVHQYFNNAPGKHDIQNKPGLSDRLNNVKNWVGDKVKSFTNKPNPKPESSTYGLSGKDIIQDNPVMAALNEFNIIITAGQYLADDGYDVSDIIISMAEEIFNDSSLVKIAKSHENAPKDSPECGTVCQMRHNGMTYEEAMAHWNKEKKDACLETFINVTLEKTANHLNKFIASSNKPCATCGMPTDSCVCLDGTNMSPGYTQGGTQRKNNPVKTKSNKPKELNPSAGGLGKL